MSNIHKRYGTYYGELVSFDENPDIQFANVDTEKLVSEMRELGVKEILFDLEDGDDCSFTMFFRTDESTDFRSLMVLIVNRRPHEFSEESDHHFRMWFD